MSIVVCLITPAAVYMAADSRQYPSGNDNVQKIFLVNGDGMVGHSGVGFLPSGTAAQRPWDAEAEIGNIVHRTKATSFTDRLKFFQDEALKSLNAGLRNLPLAVNGNGMKLSIMLAQRGKDGKGYCARQDFIVEHHPPDNPISRMAAPEIVANGATKGLWWGLPDGCMADSSTFSGPTAEAALAGC